MKTFISSAALVLLPVVIFAQGPLNPPAPPAPTMKTLDQVEARIPINATNTPGDDTFEFRIGSRGSYYLTGDILTQKVVGIYVNVGGVTLDLNGFSILRTALPGGRGILIAGGSVTIRNGFIRGWETGVTSSDPNFREGTYEQLVVTDCTQNGIVGGKNWLIDRCMALRNGNVGIAATGGNMRITNSVASSNGAGISLPAGGRVTGCIASENKNHGIFGNSVTIANCSVQNNEQHGISVGQESIVRDNQVNDNGTDANTAGAGVHAFSDRNRILGNTVVGNDKGIFITSRANVIDGNSVRAATGPGIEVTVANGKNIIIRNQAGDNGGSYSAIAAGNNLAPVTAPENASNPYTNILN